MAENVNARVKEIDETMRKEVDTVESVSDENDVVQYALTTIDNPYDPFNDFIHWFLFDVGHGYNTCGILATLAPDIDELSEPESIRETNHTIDFIIQYDFSNKYKRVERTLKFM